MQSRVKKIVILFLLAIAFCACSKTDFHKANSNNTKNANTQKPLLNQSSSTPQKLADTPKDKPISVLLASGVIACYAPEFRNGQSQIALKPCTQAPSARYDVFGRIAFAFGSNYWCISEPANLDSKRTQRLELRACVINEPTQSFSVKNNAFFSHSNLQVQDLDGYLVLSPDRRAKNHALSGMQDWINTIATPVNLSISTFLAWDFATGSGTFDTYYLKNDESVKNTPITLIYNPLSGQIAQYNQSNGSFVCLTSNQSRSQSWNWVIWTRCDFIESRQTISTQSWDLDLFGLNNKSFVRDYLGNYLRLTQYGAEWGVPYTATPTYVATDTTNAPTSLFRFDNSLQDFVRFFNGNIGDNLPFCPAGSKNLQANTESITQATATNQNLLYIPPDFNLTEAWIRRLWAIASSTDGVAQRAGDCGVCMLQSYQIIAELNEYPQNPLTSGGYFFDAVIGMNPFPSFRARYPLLARALENYTTRNLPSGLTQQEAFTQTAQMYRAIALTMYPQRNYRSEHFATNTSQIRDMLDSFMSAPAGTSWILNIYSRDRSGRQSGHAMPVIRTGAGLIFIPTNTLNATYGAYANVIRNQTAHNTNEAMSIITRRYTQDVYLLFSLRIEEPYANPLNNVLSVNNCTGEGDDRHGSRGGLSLRLINQCASGRCLIQ